MKKFTMLSTLALLASLALIGCGGETGGTRPNIIEPAVVDDDVLDEASDVEVDSDDFDDDSTASRALSGANPGMFNLYVDQLNVAAVSNALAASPNKPGRFGITTIAGFNGNYQASINNLKGLVKLNSAKGISTTVTLYAEHHMGGNANSFKAWSKRLKSEFIGPVLANYPNTRFQLGCWNEDQISSSQETPKSWSDVKIGLKAVLSGIGANITVNGASQPSSRYIRLIRCPLPVSNAGKPLGSKTRSTSIEVSFGTKKVKRSFSVVSEWHGHPEQAAGYYQYSNDGILLYDTAQGETASLFDPDDADLAGDEIVSFSNWMNDTNKISGLAFVSPWRPNYHLWKVQNGKLRKPGSQTGRTVSATSPGFNSVEENLLTRYVGRTK